MRDPATAGVPHRVVAPQSDHRKRFPLRARFQAWDDVGVMNHLRELRAALPAEWDALPRPPELVNSTIERNPDDHFWLVRGGACPEVARWRTHSFPGCRSICVTTDSWLAPELRGRGLGRYLRDLRERAYLRAGFNAEMCTVRDDNKPQVALMELRGTRIGRFRSDHGGTYSLWLTSLPSITNATAEALIDYCHENDALPGDPY